MRVNFSESETKKPAENAHTSWDKLRKGNGTLENELIYSFLSPLQTLMGAQYERQAPGDWLRVNTM